MLPHLTIDVGAADHADGAARDADADGGVPPVGRPPSPRQRLRAASGCGSRTPRTSTSTTRSSSCCTEAAQGRTSQEGPLSFTIPLFEPLPPQYFVRAISDRWLGVRDHRAAAALRAVLPQATRRAHRAARPAAAAALGGQAIPKWEGIFPFDHFNPVQTQIFHTVYHTDDNVLVGSPTGSGKTVTAELAVLRLLPRPPGHEGRVHRAAQGARPRADGRLGRQVRLEARLLAAGAHRRRGARRARARARRTSSCTTPEKWDGVSRHWQQRGYVRKVGLVIIDEIHFLGEERGPHPRGHRLADAVHRDKTGQHMRIVGLSTAMANAGDLAEWLGIPTTASSTSSRRCGPVPIEVHIAGFPGKHYCPRMATMNKPTYRAILNHSPDKPTLVFVSSRRQTRLTALDLIAFCSADERERQFVNMAPQELEPLLTNIKDQALAHARLRRGHPPRGARRDRPLRRRALFVEQKIMVLVCTATLAWGVNFPAHLVVVKGTEFYDGKQKRYVDFPVTDVLQMMGRAGRPQFDDQGVAVILVHEPKKTFYRKFLYEPFPVESCLQEQLHDHVNAEIVSGTIRSKPGRRRLPLVDVLLPPPHAQPRVLPRWRPRRSTRRSPSSSPSWSRRRSPTCRTPAASRYDEDDGADRRADDASAASPRTTTSSTRRSRSSAPRCTTSTTRRPSCPTSCACSQTRRSTTSSPSATMRST